MEEVSWSDSFPPRLSNLVEAPFHSARGEKKILGKGISESLGSRHASIGM